MKLPKIPKYLLNDTYLSHEGLSEFECELSTALKQKGFVVIDLPIANFERVADGIINDLNGELSQFASRVQDSSNKLVLELACNKEIINLLSKIWGETAFPFQTLNFKYGTQQDQHSDEVHFNCMPEKFMCGVWVALEDIHEEAGPVFYYPGSNMLPLINNHDIGMSEDEFNQLKYHGLQQGLYKEYWESLIKMYHFEKELLLIKKGQALIWTSGLVHGGSKILDRSLTRWSQVTHYFFENCTYYTPMLSHIPSGNIHIRSPINLTSRQV